MWVYICVLAFGLGLGLVLGGKQVIYLTSGVCTEHEQRHSQGGRM